MNDGNQREETSRAQDRDLVRARAAAARTRASGGSAMQAAGAAIAAVFGPGLDHRMLKQRVRSIMGRGRTGPEVEKRYAAYTGMFPTTLATLSSAADIQLALWLVTMERSFERHQIAVSKHAHAGVNRRPRISIMLLDELNLILRWMRRQELSR